MPRTVRSRYSPGADPRPYNPFEYDVYSEEVTPDLLMGESQAAGASADPNALAYQSQALDQLGRQISLNDRGILTDGQRTQYEDLYGNAAQVAGAGRAALGQQMEARGQGGSDVSAAMAQMGTQAAAQQRATADAQMQAQLADRTQQMRAAYSQLARGARDQSFDESYARGQAADAASWYDADYMRGVGQRETDRQDRQSQADAGATQQAWQNEARGILGDAGDMAENLANNYEREQERRERTTSAFQSILDTAGGISNQGFGGIIGSFGDDDEEDD